MRLDDNAGLANLIRRLEAKVVQQRTEIQQLEKIIGRQSVRTQPITRTS